MEGTHGNPDNEEIPEGEPKTWPCRNLQGELAEDQANGTIVLYDYEVDLEELKKLAALKEQNKNLKTLISVGGWTLSNNLSLVARTEETRETFAQSAVDFVREFDLDGLDLDWEYPVSAGMENNHRDPSDKQNHTLLLQAVRDAFTEAGKEDGKEYLLSIAGAATWAYAENNELDKISEIVDFVQIMAYDINGTWTGLTGHNAPLYADPLEAEVRGWNFGVDGTLNIYGAVPKNKLVLGLPFYGHSWAGCNVDQDGKMVEENGPYQQCAAGWEQPGLAGGTVGYDVIKPLINQDGYRYYFDNVSKVPYLYNEEKGEFISYDNVESIGYKVNLIKESGLAGAMIWDLATDDEDYNLLKTVSYGLGISSEAPEPDESGEPEPGEPKDPVDPEDPTDPPVEPEPKPEKPTDPPTGTEDPTDPSGDPGAEDPTDPPVDPGTEDPTDPSGDPGTEEPTEPLGDSDDGDTGVDEDKTPATKLESNQKNNGGNVLPSTATNTFNILMVGLLVIIAGAGLYFYQRRKIVEKN